MSDRHEKWQAVEPGHIIPAGQPYRCEYGSHPGDWTAIEGLSEKPKTPVREGNAEAWFVDSSWRPPLELPTEDDGWYLVGLRRKDGKGIKYRVTNGRKSGQYFAGYQIDRIVSVSPLTPEQVARIEGAR